MAHLTLALIAALTLAPLTAARQSEDSAVIRVEISDDQGAVIPGVTVTLTLKQCYYRDCKDPKKCACCPDQRIGISDERGIVSFSVSSGEYRVQVALSGFKSV